MSEYECLRKDSCPIRLDVEKQLEEGGTISQSGPLMAIRTGKSVTLQQKFSTGGRQAYRRNKVYSGRHTRHCGDEP